MTDRIRTMHVILDDDYRTDDADSIWAAILMIKGISKVEFGDAVEVNDHIVREDIRRKLTKALFDVVKP